MSRNSIIIIVILALVLGGMVYFLSTGNDDAEPNTNATSTPPVVTNNPPANTQAKAPEVSLDDEAPSNTTVVLTGSVKPNGAQTTYRYQYGKTSDLGSQTSAQSIGSGFGTIPTTGYITALTPSTLYYYRLTATNSIGTVNSATRTFTTSATGTPPPVTAAPTAATVAATEIDRTSADIGGNVNPKGSPTSYWFEYGTTDSLGIATSIKSAGSSETAQAISTSISNLQPNTKYFFRVNAQNNFGTVNGTILSFTTDGPAAVNKPTVEIKAAAGVSAQSATLHGTVMPNGATTTFWFEYSTDSLVGTVLGTATSEQSVDSSDDSANVSASLTDLAKNTKYNYRIAAKNSQGTVRSEVMSFTTNGN
jgi:phosphodiesterase/alkaline phosphatase D-like protein